MKKAQMEKSKGRQITSAIRQAPVPGRFGHASVALQSRKEQRKLDQAAGLIPFAVKLPGDLVGKLRVLADDRRTGMNEITAELLEKALASRG